MPMEHSSGDLMRALIAKLYQVITGDDESITIPRNKFVSWYLPGVPFAPEDFQFASRGLAGETAEAVANSYHQAFVVASLFDFVPDVSSGFVDNQLQLIGPRLVRDKRRGHGCGIIERRRALRWLRDERPLEREGIRVRIGRTASVHHDDRVDADGPIVTRVRDRGTICGPAAAGQPPRVE